MNKSALLKNAFSFVLIVSDFFGKTSLKFRFLQICKFVASACVLIDFWSVLLKYCTGYVESVRLCRDFWWLVLITGSWSSSARSCFSSCQCWLLFSCTLLLPCICGGLHVWRGNPWHPIGASRPLTATSPTPTIPTATRNLKAGSRCWECSVSPYFPLYATTRIVASKKSANHILGTSHPENDKSDERPIKEFC